MKNKTIGIWIIGIIGLLLLSSLNISAASVSTSKENLNKTVTFDNGQRFFIAFIQGTVDELYHEDKYAFLGDAKDIKISSFKGTFNIGDDYEGSDYFRVKIFIGKITFVGESAESIKGIALILDVEAL
jgi:hypothetical protein